MLSVPTLRLPRISVNKSSSSPDPKKLLSRVSSAQGLGCSSGLKEESVLGEAGKRGRTRQATHQPLPASSNLTPPTSEYYSPFC